MQKNTYVCAAVTWKLLSKNLNPPVETNLFRRKSRCASEATHPQGRSNLKPEEYWIVSTQASMWDVVNDRCHSASSNALKSGRSVFGLRGINKGATPAYVLAHLAAMQQCQRWSLQHSQMMHSIVQIQSVQASSTFDPSPHPAAITHQYYSETF